jgi:hypothetical protein
VVTAHGVQQRVIGISPSAPMIEIGGKLAEVDLKLTRPAVRRMPDDRCPRWQDAAGRLADCRDPARLHEREEALEPLSAQLEFDAARPAIQ